jgi:hypothetical protein
VGFPEKVPDEFLKNISFIPKVAWGSDLIF